ncbi:hypothetical protein [Kitasatospora sp. NPDC088346]|uniref:hypothetical protein n=1 Tax=Kitasatospora sp. NPDC088346 TaxID=3364073 RepID=UPI0038251356
MTSAPDSRHWSPEVSAFRGRWTLNIISPDRAVLAGPEDLGSADTLVKAHPDDPGQRLIAIDGEVAVLPRDHAVRQLEEHGFVVADETRDDTKTGHGWTQVASALWIALCHPIA